MKRLLCIVGSMNAGGAETFLMKIYRQLDKTKYQMDFAVAVNERGYYEDEIERLGGRIFRITPKSQGAIKNFVSIRELVKRENYKYVLRTSQHSLSALELLAAKWGGSKIRIFRSSNSNTTTGSKKSLILHKICLFMPKFFANVRIAPSTEAAEYMFGKKCVQRGKAFLLHNGLDLDTYKYDDQAREQIRKEFGLQNSYVVGHVGRFNQQKNHQFLLSVFKGIRTANPNAKLLLVGVGELQDTIKKATYDMGIADDVIFAGLRNDVPKMMSAFDVFLFPSLYEGMPNTVIEAQASGLHCIISDKVTREAKLTNDVSFVPIDQGIDKWIDAFNRIQEMKAENRAVVSQTLKEKGYDINDVAKKFVSIAFQFD